MEPRNPPDTVGNAEVAQGSQNEEAGEVRGVSSGPSLATPGMSEETVGRVHDHSRWGEEVVDSSVIMHSACPVRKKRGPHRERAALTHECCTAPHRQVGTCTPTYRHTDIQTHRHADMQTHRHTDRQTDIYTVQLNFFLLLHCHVQLD